MRRFVIAVAVVAVCVATCAVYAADDKPFDFRNVRWGMTKDEVLKSEGEKPTFESTGSNSISMNDYLFSKKVKLSYIFDDNERLYAAYYSLDKENNPNITEMELKLYYNKLIDVLSEKYGSHKQGEIHTSSTKEALEWNSGDTQVTIRLGSHNGRLLMLLSYHSKDLKAKQDERSKQRNKEKL